LLLEPCDCDSDSCSHDIDHTSNRSNDSSCSVGALRAAVLVGAIVIAVGDIIVLILLAMVAMLIVIVRRIAVLAMVYGMVMVAVGAIIAVP
jgi:hypothetical protein